MSLVETIQRRKILSAVLSLGVLLVIAVSAFAITMKIAPVSSGWWGPINEDDGIALKGYDAVGYHQSQQALPGSEAITFHWEGVTWRFTSEENRTAFAQDPQRYAPQYGGFCATAVSAGVTADIEPGSWQIVEGKLYVFNGEDPKQSWREELDSGIIARGDANWATR